MRTCVCLGYPRLNPFNDILVPRSFVPLDQRSENEISGSLGANILKSFEITKEITEFFAHPVSHRQHLWRMPEMVALSWFLPQARRIVGSGDENGSTKQSWKTQMATSLISERFRQFCFFTKRSTLLLENSRKINFLHLFIIEQHVKLLPYLLILVKGIREPHEVKKKSFDLGGNRTHDLQSASAISLPRVVPWFPLPGQTPSGLFMG